MNLKELSITMKFRLFENKVALTRNRGLTYKPSFSYNKQLDLDSSFTFLANGP